MHRTSVTVRRALVQRHTTAGRAFWGALAELCAGDVTTLHALLAAAAEGPATVHDWLVQAGVATSLAPAVDDALAAFVAVPGPRSPTLARRAVQVVRGQARAGVVQVTPALA